MRAFVLIATLALTGCGGSISVPDPLNLSGTKTATAAASFTLTGDPFVDFNPLLGRIAKFTNDDVTNALADAKLHKDDVGVLCWERVQENLPAIKSQQQAQATGAATIIQEGRDLQTEIPKIADACANILPTGLASIAKVAPPALP